MTDPGNEPSAAPGSPDTARPTAAEPEALGAIDAELVTEALIARIVSEPGVVVVLGGESSGKTRFARRLLAAGVQTGLRPVYVDTDLGQTTTGPPGTVGSRQLTTAAQVADPFAADALAFVGGISPRGRQLPLLTGTARLVAAARNGSSLVVVDTSGFVAGLEAEALKAAKLEVVRPRYVVALRRREELDQVLRAVRRLSAADLTVLPVSPAALRRTDAQRAEHRRSALQRWFSPPVRRVAVEHAALVPAPGADADVALLDGLLVGTCTAVRCTGIGVLEWADQRLTVLVPAHAPEPTALQLGAVAVDAEWRTRSIDLRTLLRRR